MGVIGGSHTAARAPVANYNALVASVTKNSPYPEACSNAEAYVSDWLVVTSTRGARDRPGPAAKDRGTHHQPLAAVEYAMEL